MTDQQSTNTETNAIPAGQLERRQHVITEHLGADTIAQVEHPMPYRDSDRRPMVAALLSPVGGGDPFGKKWAADQPVRLATEDQVADAVDAARRETVVKGLRDLADLIADCRIRIRPYGGPGISLRLVDGEVTRLAEALELKLSDYGQATKSAIWRADSSDEYGDGVSVTFYGKPAPEPEAEPEQEWLFTFGAGHKHEGHFVRITGTHESARARMVEVFGTEWCAAYTWRSFDTEGLAAKLTELPEDEWPVPTVLVGD